MPLIRQQQEFGRIKCRQADQTYEAPDTPGIYSWYYVPKYSSDEDFSSKIASLCMSTGFFEGKLSIDYGVTLSYESLAEPKYNKEKDSTLIGKALKDYLNPVKGAFEDFLVPFFTRPVYIGMAKSLQSRLYGDHYKQLQTYWEPNSQVSLFLASLDKDYSASELVEKTIKKFSLYHSFALDARIRGFSPRDLKAYYIETSEFEPNRSIKMTDEEEKESRRTIEKLFQLISLPVCGRI